MKYCRGGDGRGCVKVDARSGTHQLRGYVRMSNVGSFGYGGRLEGANKAERIHLQFTLPTEGISPKKEVIQILDLDTYLEEVSSWWEEFLGYQPC